MRTGNELVWISNLIVIFFKHVDFSKKEANPKKTICYKHQISSKPIVRA